MILRPFLEFYLTDQFWVDPMTELHLGGGDTLAVTTGPLFREIDKWACFSRNFLEHPKQRAE